MNKSEIRQEDISSATMYVWGQKLDICKMCELLGGQVAPSNTERALHAFNHSLFCTPQYQIRPVSLDQEMKAQNEKKSRSPQRNRGFVTYQLQPRLETLRLDMPQQEIIFSPRWHSAVFDLSGISLGGFNGAS